MSHAALHKKQIDLGFGCANRKLQKVHRHVLIQKVQADEEDVAQENLFLGLMVGENNLPKKYPKA